MFKKVTEAVLQPLIYSYHWQQHTRPESEVQDANQVCGKVKDGSRYRKSRSDYGSNKVNIFDLLVDELLTIHTKKVKGITITHF